MAYDGKTIKTILDKEKESTLKEIETEYRNFIERLPEEWTNLPVGVILDALENEMINDKRSEADRKRK